LPITKAGRSFGVSPYDTVFLPVLGGLVAVAWAALAVWSASPYGRYVSHDWTNPVLAAYLCAASPAGEIAAPAVFYVLGWLLMTVAMMLPTALPVLAVFGRLVGARAHAGRLVAIAVGGYLLVWLGFGVAAHLIGAGVVALARRSTWLAFNGWAIGAGLLLIAGLFQFSRLKYRCLDACGAPLSFVLARWRGRRPAVEALHLGVAHGVFCVGCCWALMLLLFAMGTGSIGWMLALGAAMATEKNTSWGRLLARPLGVALFGCAGVVAALNLLARP
jgi:predicted metal-binding membrane protein